MTDPWTALLTGGIIVAVLALFLWPGKGIVALIRAARLKSSRELVEDALKHLYDFEYRKTSCTLESVAGVLSISGDEAARLVRRLESMKLILRRDRILELSTGGRAYALRIIRVHRLWERYLADETAVQEAEWHEQAERKEHQLTTEQAEALARRLGEPAYDPHGDPIPSAEGAIPARRGQALTTLKPGDGGGIIHIEDEPASVYAQLVAQRLAPGMSLRVIESDDHRVVFESAGNEVVLAPVAAANVTVVPLGKEDIIESTGTTLASLTPGWQAVVTGIASSCRGLQRRRLMDLGLVPGTTVTAEMRNPSGDPTAYAIRGATIALRKDQAELVYTNEQKAVTP